MIDRKAIYQTALRVVKETKIEAKIYNVIRTPEEVVVYYYSEKRIPLRELARDLEFTLNVPIKLERVTKEEFGRVGETQILAYHQCCAPLSKKCLFDHSHGCPYGLPIQEDAPPPAPTAAKKTAPPQKKAKKPPAKKKIIRRIVVK
jgi:hypothetical protein